jgi:hypothetical protein
VCLSRYRARCLGGLACQQSRQLTELVSSRLSDQLTAVWFILACTRINHTEPQRAILYIHKCLQRGVFAIAEVLALQEPGQDPRFNAQRREFNNSKLHRAGGTWEPTWLEALTNGRIIGYRRINEISGPFHESFELDREWTPSVQVGSRLYVLIDPIQHQTLLELGLD